MRCLPLLQSSCGHRGRMPGQPPAVLGMATCIAFHVVLMLDAAAWYNACCLDAMSETIIWCELSVARVVSE